MVGAQCLRGLGNLLIYGFKLKIGVAASGRDGGHKARGWHRRRLGRLRRERTQLGAFNIDIIGLQHDAIVFGEFGPLLFRIDQQQLGLFGLITIPIGIAARALAANVERQFNIILANQISNALGCLRR